MAGTEDSDEQIFTDLIREVELAPTRQMRGSELALRFRIRHPDFKFQQYGVLRLKQFIEQYVPRLQIVGSSGGDPIYGFSSARGVGAEELLPSGLLESSAPAENSFILWRHWSSPQSPFAIAVDRQTLRARQILPGTASKTEIEILPAPPAVHLAIAKNFINSDDADAAVPEDLRQKLEAFIRESDGRWWEAWADELGRRPEVGRVWFKYRRRAMEEELARRLNAAGLNSSDASAVATRISGPSRDRSNIGRTPETEARPQSSPSGGRDKLLELAKSAIQQLSERDLRDLKLPLGIVVDVMEGRK